MYARRFLAKLVILQPFLLDFSCTGFSLNYRWSLVCIDFGSAVQLCFFNVLKTGLAISLAIFSCLYFFKFAPLFSLSVILWLVGGDDRPCGYFGGRIFGGPKLARGTAQKNLVGCSNRIGFALVTVIFGEDVGVGLSLKHIIFSLFLSIASQIGDIYESALKDFGMRGSSLCYLGTAGSWIGLMACHS